MLWTPVLVPGLIGLLVSRDRPLRALGIGSLVLLLVIAVRVPIMYEQAGGGPINIGGLIIVPPPSRAAARELVRSDNNRYVTVLLPFALLGLRELVGLIGLWRRGPAAESEP